jgi:hypothetical protein
MAKRKLAPIALFVYSRLEHTKATVKALSENTLAKETDLIVFSDGPKNSAKIQQVKAVREFVHSIKGFKSVKVIESKENNGLAKSIISGVSQIVNKYGRVIVVEDDLLTSPYFLEFMNDGLDFYEKDNRVVSISGYLYPSTDLPETFFIRDADCWGWATWKRGWSIFEEDGKKLLRELKEKGLTKEFNYEDTYDYIEMLEDQIAGKNNSWAIRWYASAFLKNKLTLYPGKSLVRNIGIDGSGTHGGLVDIYYTELTDRKINVKQIPVLEDKIARHKFAIFFKKMHSKIFRLTVLIRTRLRQIFA